MRGLQNQPLTLDGSSSTKVPGQASNALHWCNGNLYVTIQSMSYQILIGGGTKKRQQRNIDQAVALWEDYKRCKALNRQGK